MIKNINGRENLGRNHYDRNRKGNKITVLVNEFGMPVSLTVAAANTHDSKLIMSSINSSTVKIVRSRIIADKGYINARIKRKLRRSANISLIYPYRRNQNRNNTTFEKNLLKKRHIVENFFSWLKKYRRIQQRYDCTSIIYLNFVYFGTANLMINKLF
jgi:transposase